MNRKQRRKYRKVLGTTATGSVGPANKPPNQLIDRARALVAQDPTGGLLDAWRDDYLAYVADKGRKYPLLVPAIRERVHEAYEIARREAGLDTT